MIAVRLIDRSWLTKLSRTWRSAWSRFWMRLMP